MAGAEQQALVGLVQSDRATGVGADLGERHQGAQPVALAAGLGAELLGGQADQQGGGVGIVEVALGHDGQHARRGDVAGLHRRTFGRYQAHALAHRRGGQPLTRTRAQ
ncbi:MAG: hypothetical protein IPG03_03525 [Candidatus Microthrix sp.]|nr:hypothetical protein [Candidatus Microthrix sp.]MBK6501455.1 hypothetical protein [Candidatus Microthrix sp.]